VRRIPVWNERSIQVATGPGHSCGERRFRNSAISFGIGRVCSGAAAAYGPGGGRASDCYRFKHPDCARGLANLQKASELDPHNDEIAFYLGQIYLEMGRYSELEQLLTKRAAASGKLDSLELQNHLAQIKLAQGDLVAAQSLLEKVPLDYSPGFWIWGTRFTAALYLRDYDAANRVIAATPAKWADFAFGEQTASWAEGQVARARGDKQKALEAFAAARKKIEAKFGDIPKDAVYLSEVGTLDAGLGRKEEAIREARRAVDLLPIAKDSLNGPDLVAQPGAGLRVDG